MNNTEIHHNHMLIRMEMINSPTIKDISNIKKLLKKIIKDINMKLLGVPHIYYVETPHEKKGITGICTIQTSHLSFHIWENPGNHILQNSKSKGLMQFDIYTCGELTKNNAKSILENIKIFIPTRIDIDILDRKKTLKLKHHLHWNDNGKLSFENFLEKKF